MAVTPDTVNGHWSTLIEGLQESPLDFYDEVRATVAKKSISDLKFERIEYREGGVFSGFRPYLRIRRYREVFDVCGAPFGNGFFCSWWFAQVRPKMPAFASILVVLGYLALIGTFMNAGFIRGPIILVLLVLLALFLLSRMGSPDTDDFILALPLIGPLYERFFRPMTYYRIDTSMMFQKSVAAAVMEVIDQITAAKGVRGLTELERKPVMREFFGK